MYHVTQNTQASNILATTAYGFQHGYCTAKPTAGAVNITSRSLFVEPLGHLIIHRLYTLGTHKTSKHQVRLVL